MTSRTFLNADGTYTTEAYTRPIHYMAADNSWRPIDTTLKLTTSPVTIGSLPSVGEGT